jgi:hypothetical protein
MRPHFSIRILLLAIAVSAFASYWAFARPTVIARKFMRAVEVGDYQRAEAFCLDRDCRFLSVPIDELSDVSANAKLHPRQWRDIWTFKRRMLLQIVPAKSRPGSTDRVGFQAEVVATPSGIEPPEVYVVTFKR